MNKIILFFLAMIFIINLIQIEIVLADNQELTELEVQQLKILKLFQVVASHPTTEDLKRNIEDYQIGWGLFQQKDYINAIPKFSRIQYSSLNLPLYVKSQFLLGECLKKIDEWDKAVEVYKNLAQIDPLLTDYSIFFLAEIFQTMGNNIESITEYKRIIENIPKSLIASEARYQIAQNYIRLNDLVSAVTYYQDILKDNSSDIQLKANVLLDLANIYWKEGRHIDAFYCWYEIVEKGYKLKRNSEPEELLIRYFNMMKEDLPDTKVPYSIMVKCADILFKYRQYNLAEELYREIIEKFPDTKGIDEVYYSRARALYYKKDYIDAINQCNEIISKFPLSDIIIKVHYFFANSLLASGEHHSAIEEYNKIIAQYPESYYARESYLRLSECYFQLNEPEKGIYQWKQGIEKYPNSDQAMNALWNLGRYYTKKNNHPEALEAYKVLSERFSKSKLGDDSLFWRGKTLQSLGLEDEANLIYDKLVRDYPLSYYVERTVELRGKRNFLLQVVANPENKNFSNLEEFLEKFSQITAYYVDHSLFRYLI